MCHRRATKMLKRSRNRLGQRHFHQVAMLLLVKPPLGHNPLGDFDGHHSDTAVVIHFDALSIAVWHQLG